MLQSFVFVFALSSSLTALHHSLRASANVPVFTPVISSAMKPFPMPALVPVPQPILRSKLRHAYLPASRTPDASTLPAFIFATTTRLHQLCLVKPRRHHRRQRQR